MTMRTNLIRWYWTFFGNHLNEIPYILSINILYILTNKLKKLSLTYCILVGKVDGMV